MKSAKKLKSLRRKLLADEMNVCPVWYCDDREYLEY